MIPIPGMRRPQQATDNMGAIDWTMTLEERRAIEQAEELTRS